MIDDLTNAFFNMLDFSNYRKGRKDQPDRTGQDIQDDNADRI